MKCLSYGLLNNAPLPHLCRHPSSAMPSIQFNIVRGIFGYLELVYPKILFVDIFRATT
jgi:hypothetical protein